MADYDEYPLQDEYLQRRQVLQQSQQPRPQQPLPQSPQQPGMIEQYGPLVGSAVMAYLNAIASPKAGGVGNAIRNAAVGGVNAYQSFEGMSQDAQKRRAQAAALGQLPEKYKTLAGAGVPMGVIGKGYLADQQQEIGLQSNQLLADEVSKWKVDPSVSPQQRAAADLIERDLRVSMTPWKKEEVIKALHAGWTPKPGSLSFQEQKDLAKYKQELKPAKPAAAEKPMSAAQLRAHLAQHPEDAEAAAAVERLNQQEADKPTSSTKTMREAAPGVIALADRVEALIDKNAPLLGPGSGRWNEFMTGKIGAPNPEFMRLRTDADLLATLMMRMHMGARGGEHMMEKFRDLFETGKQSPENLKAALDEARRYARDDVMGGGAKKSAAEPAPAAAQAGPGGAPAGGGGIDLGDGFRLEPR